jgi:enamine deaminase RidA (YjgF/YER057c/UK114 family)
VAQSIRFINPKTMAKPPGYTNVVEATGPARTVYIAGQLGLDLDNRLVGGPGDFRAQCEKAFENLRLALAAVGGGFKDLVKINNYLVDMSHVAIFREVRDRFLAAPPPVSTTMAISQLARPGALFEIEAIAVLPAKAAAKSKRKPAAARKGRRKVKATRRKRR